MNRFADTFFYLALLNPRDRMHPRAVQMSRVADRHRHRDRRSPNTVFPRRKSRNREAGVAFCEITGMKRKTPPTMAGMAG